MTVPASEAVLGPLRGLGGLDDSPLPIDNAPTGAGAGERALAMSPALRRVVIWLGLAIVLSIAVVAILLKDGLTDAPIRPSAPTATRPDEQTHDPEVDAALKDIPVYGGFKIDSRGPRGTVRDGPPASPGSRISWFRFCSRIQ